jgi:arylsulfatase A-like enzyme
MKFLIWVWTCGLLMSFGVSEAAEAERHVVLITIDGFPARMFNDPKSSIPTIRELAREGTVAEGMRVSNPSVTWPNHTTLVTGVHPEKHSVLYNGILKRGDTDVPVAVDPKRTKAELVAVPTLYDFLHEKGLRTAGINWPCTRAAKSLEDDFPDVPDTLVHTTPRLREELVSAGILPSAKDADFRAMSGPARDEVWTRAAVHVIQKRKPHLLLFHLLNTDGIHHRYGPQSPASYTALALADTYVRQVLEALESAGIRSNSTVIVTSDHGFAAATNLLHPNAIFRRAGLLELGASNVVTKARVQLVSEGGMGMIYLNNPATREADRKTVLELLSGKEGVEGMLEPDDFGKHGLPTSKTNKGIADLILIAKDGYGVSASAAGENLVAPVGQSDNSGYHGYIATNSRMQAAFIAAGAGVKRGAKIGLIENRDIAPTIAHLLNQKLPNCDGKVLSEILQ